MAYFPFMIEIEDKNCLVVGGGSIAFHKVKILAEFGVHIQVIAPVICESLWKLAEESGSVLAKMHGGISQKNGMGLDSQQKKNREQENYIWQIELVERKFQDCDIDGMDFVVAATDDEELNYHISDLCRQKNILINTVDMKEACSFIFPAMIKDRDMLIAVSSGGQSPAGAAYVKRQIRHYIPDYYGEMIEQLGEYRDYILEHVDTAKKRKEIFNRLLEYGDVHDGKIPKEVVEMLIKEEQTRQIADGAV